MLLFTHMLYTMCTGQEMKYDHYICTSWPVHMIIITCSVCVKTIMAESSTFDQSVIRRLIFAAKQIPEETPRYWDMVSSFGFNGTSVGSSVNDVRVMIENLEFMDHKTFLSDRELFKELCMKEGFEKKIILVLY